jgi:serine/threonine protein kinase
VNSKGKKRRPGSRSLFGSLKAPTDRLFVDFIFRCFSWDPEKRLTPIEALRHPWICSVGPKVTPVGSGVRTLNLSNQFRSNLNDTSCYQTGGLVKKIELRRKERIGSGLETSHLPATSITQHGVTSTFGRDNKLRPYTAVKPADKSTIPQHTAYPMVTGTERRDSGNVIQTRRRSSGKPGAPLDSYTVAEESLRGSKATIIRTGAVALPPLSGNSATQEGFNSSSLRVSSGRQHTVERQDTARRSSVRDDPSKQQVGAQTPKYTLKTRRSSEGLWLVFTSYPSNARCLDQAPSLPTTSTAHRLHSQVPRRTSMETQTQVDGDTIFRHPTKVSALAGRFKHSIGDSDVRTSENTLNQEFIRGQPVYKNYIANSSGKSQLGSTYNRPKTSSAHPSTLRDRRLWLF